jgi:hypothetical protein
MYALLAFASMVTSASTMTYGLVGGIGCIAGNGTALQGEDGHDPPTGDDERYREILRQQSRWGTANSTAFIDLPSFRS